MGFKESVYEDLETVIFDSEELADEHTVDGERMNIIIRNITMEDAREAKGATRPTVNPKESAVNESSFHIYIRESDARKLQRKKFTVGARIQLDGKSLFVQNVNHIRGMWELGVGAHTV